MALRRTLLFLFKKQNCWKIFWTERNEKTTGACEKKNNGQHGHKSRIWCRLKRSPRIYIAAVKNGASYSSSSSLSIPRELHTTTLPCTRFSRFFDYRARERAESIRLSSCRFSVIVIVDRKCTITYIVCN